MDEMTTMLQRIRTLSVQAANGTNTSSDRTSIQAEVTALSQEITRIACRTTFGGKKVLSGFGTTDSLMTALNGKIKFQVGSNHNDTQTLDMNFYEDDKSSTIKDDKDKDVNVFTDKTPDKATEDEKKIAAKGYSLENLMRAVGLNTPAEKTAKSTSASFYVDDAGLKGTKDSGYAVFDVRTSTAAQATLASIDKVINLIDTKRGDFGALENRMSSTISNQTNIMNNEFDLSTCRYRRPTARTPRQTALPSRPRSRRCLRK